MKKASKPEPLGTTAAEMEPEYHFDYAKAKPNRFANLTGPGTVAVVLDADVAKVFKDAGSVNSVLRALLETMPRHSGS